MPSNKEPRRYVPEGKTADDPLAGWIIEDVWIESGDRYGTWEPHLQAFKHNRSDLSLRYCYYNKHGNARNFAPIPSFVYDWTIDDFRDEIRRERCLVIQALLKRFISLD